MGNGQVLEYSVLRSFAALFGGRNDAYFNGHGAEWRAPTLRVFADHIKGWSESVNKNVRIRRDHEGIGTYPVTDSGQCRWGCIDLDGDEYTFSSAIDVWSIWQYYGVTAWIERSRSKGWHIWVFSEGWVPAYVMRYAGLQIVKLADLPSNTEVNPKNIAPWKTSNGLVNTVRLPYAGRALPGRQVILDARTALPLSLADFTRAARAARAPLDSLARVSDLWRAASQQEALERRFLHLQASTPLGDWQAKSNQDAMAILKGTRSVNVHERDNQLFTVAKLMRGIGIPEREALTRMQNVWYNQVDQSGHEYPLEDALKKVQRSYGI